MRCTVNKYKYDDLIWTVVIKDSNDIEEDEKYFPNGCAVNLAYERDEEKLIKMTGKGICGTADEMVYHYVDENEVDLDKLKVGDKIELDGNYIVIG